MTTTTSNHARVKEMATRAPDTLVSRKYQPCTEYQIHVGSGVIDFTERKLTRCIGECTDQQQKMVIVALLHDYLKGVIAVAWRSGRPVYIRITRDSA